MVVGGESFSQGHLNHMLPEGRGKGTVGRGVYRNYCKGHMDKIKREGGGGGGGGFVWDGEKMQTTVIE